MYWQTALAFLLDDACLFERVKSAVLLDSLKAFHGKVDDKGLAEFRDVNTALLEICLSAHRASRVKLRRADAIRIAPANQRALSRDLTSSCHS